MLCHTQFHFDSFGIFVDSTVELAFKNMYQHFIVQENEIVFFVNIIDDRCN